MRDEDPRRPQPGDHDAGHAHGAIVSLMWNDAMLLGQCSNQNILVEVREPPADSPSLEAKVEATSAEGAEPKVEAGVEALLVVDAPPTDKPLSSFPRTSASLILGKSPRSCATPPDR